MRNAFGAGFLFLALCLTPFNGCCIAAEPFAGIITADRVNVRAENNTSSEVICQLNREDKVMAVGEDDKWYKIELPKKALVYADKRNFERRGDSGVVIKDACNVRTAATQSSTVVGKLGKGAEVEILREYLDWYEIEAPAGTFGWVYADYVSDKSNSALRKEASIEEGLAELEEEYAAEIKKPYREIELTGILQRYQDFALRNKGSAKEQEAIKKIAEIKLKMVELEHLKAKQEYEAKLKDLKSPRPGEKPTASGVLEDVGRVSARRSQFKLAENGKTIAYLTSGALDLNRYINLKVNVWGVKKESKGNMALIEVDAVEVVK